MKLVSSAFESKRIVSLDQWRAPGRVMWTKVLSILVSITFLLPFMSFAFQPASYPAGLIGEFGYTPLKANGDTITIKPEWGRVTSSYQGNSGRTIVYIQDLHCNYEVQNNIRMMLDRMMKHNKLRLVGVEGESTPVNVSKLSTVPSEDLKINVSEYFMRRGRVTGPEYQAALTGGQLMLQGIEAERLYVDNRDTLMKFLNEESQGYCEDLRFALERLKRPLYNMNLAKMDHKREDFVNENITLESYCDFLLLEANTLGVSLEPYKVIRLYSLEHKLPVNALADYERLLHEAEALDRAIRQKMYTSHEQRQLDHYLYILKVMENLVNISATEEDLQYFRSHRDEFQITGILHFLEDISYRFAIQPDLDPGILKMNQFLDLAAKFYVVADKRSHAFVENTLRAMNEQKQNIAVLITGGFHASHVENALRRQGISFITVKPRITSTDAVNPYFSLLRNEKTPLEKLLARNENIFAPRSLFNNALFKRYVETVWEIELGRKLVLEQGLKDQALQETFREMRGKYAADDPNVSLVYQADKSNPEKGAYVFTFENAPEHYVVIRPNATLNAQLQIPGETLNGNNFMFHFVSQAEVNDREKWAAIIGETKGRGGRFSMAGLVAQIGEITGPATRAAGTLAIMVSRPGMIQNAFMVFSDTLSGLSPRAIREGWQGFRSMVAGNRMTAAWLTTITGVMLAGSILMGMFPLATVAFAGAFVWSAGTLMQNNQFKSLANSVFLPQGDLVARARIWARENYGYGANTIKQTDFQLALENVMSLSEGNKTLQDFIANRADRLALAGMAYRSGMMPWTEGTPSSQVEALAFDFMEAEQMAEKIKNGVKAADLVPQGNSPLAQLITAIKLNRSQFELGEEDFANPVRMLPEYVSQAQRDAMLNLAKANQVEMTVLDMAFNPISFIRPTLQQAEKIHTNVLQFKEAVAAQIVPDELLYAEAATGVQQTIETSEDALAELDGDITLGELNMTGKSQDTETVTEGVPATALDVQITERQKALLDRWFTVDGWNNKLVDLDVFATFTQAFTQDQLAGLVSRKDDNTEVHELGVTLLRKISESLMQSTEGLYSAGDMLEVFRIVWQRGLDVETATRRFMNERAEFLSRDADAPVPETFARYEAENGPVQSVADVQKMLRNGYAGEQLAIVPAYQFYADRVGAEEKAAMQGNADYAVDLMLNFNQRMGQRLAGLPAAIQEPVIKDVFAEVTKFLSGDRGAMSALVAKKLSGLITSPQEAVTALRSFDQFVKENTNEAIFQGQEDALRNGLRALGQDLLRGIAAQDAIGLFSNKAPPSQEDILQAYPELFPDGISPEYYQTLITAFEQKGAVASADANEDSSASAPKTAYQAAPRKLSQPIEQWKKASKTQKAGELSFIQDFQAPEVSAVSVKYYDPNDHDGKRGAFQSQAFRTNDGTLAYRVATGERMVVTIAKDQKVILGSTKFNNCAAGIIRGTNTKGETVISFGHLEADNPRGQFERLLEDVQNMRDAGVENLEVFVQVFPGAFEGTPADGDLPDSFFTFPRTKAEVQSALGDDVAVVDIQHKAVTEDGAAEFNDLFVDENGITVDYFANQSLAPVAYAWSDRMLATAQQGLALKPDLGLRQDAYDPWAGAVAFDAYGNDSVRGAIQTQLQRIGFTVGKNSRVSIGKDVLLERIDRGRDRLLAERTKAEQRYQFLSKKSKLSMDEVREMRTLRERIDSAFMNANAALVIIRSAVANGPALSYEVLISDQMNDREHGVAMVKGDQICLNGKQIRRYAGKNSISLMRLIAHETGHITGLEGDETGEGFAGIFARVLAGYDLGIDAINAEFPKAAARLTAEAGTGRAYSGARATGLAFSGEEVAAIRNHFRERTAVRIRTDGTRETGKAEFDGKGLNLYVNLFSPDAISSIMRRRNIGKVDAVIAYAEVLFQHEQFHRKVEARRAGFYSSQELDAIYRQLGDNMDPNIQGLLAIIENVVGNFYGYQPNEKDEAGVPIFFEEVFANYIESAGAIDLGYSGNYAREQVFVMAVNLLIKLTLKNLEGRRDPGSAQLRKFLNTVAQTAGMQDMMPKSARVSLDALNDYLYDLRGKKTAAQAQTLTDQFDATETGQNLAAYFQERLALASKDINISASSQARIKPAMTMDNAVLRSAVTDQTSLKIKTVGEDTGRGLRVAAVQDQLPHPVDTNFTNWLNRTRANVDSLQSHGAELVVFPERYLATSDAGKMQQAMEELHKQAQESGISMVMGVRLLAGDVPVDGVLFISPGQPAVIARDMDTLRAVKEGNLKADPASRAEVKDMLARYPVLAKAFADGIEMEDNLVGFEKGHQQFILHLNICADARNAENFKDLPINVDLAVNVASTRPEDVPLYVENIRKGVGESTPVLVVNAGVTSARHGGNTTISLDGKNAYQLRADEAKNGALAFEVAGVSAAPVLMDDFNRVAARQDALEQEKSDIFARHIQLRANHVGDVLNNFIEDKALLEKIRGDLAGISAENLDIQNTDRIMGALAVNARRDGKIRIILERQLDGNLKASTVLHEVIESVLEANGVEKSHALSFIVEHALYPESIEAKLHNPEHYDDAHLAEIISNTENVIREIDQQVGLSEAARTQQKNNAIDVLKAARKTLAIRQRAAALSLGERGFYGEETQQTLTRLMTEFLKNRKGMANTIRQAARQQNIVASQTADLADAIVKQGFSFLSQKQLNAFFAFFGHDVETRASDYTRELLREEVQRLEKPLSGTMYQASMARLRNVLDQLEKGQPISVAVLGENQNIVDLKVRKVSSKDGVTSRAEEIGAFMTVESTARGNIGYINVLEGHNISEAVLHEVLESVLGEPHQTVNELSTFSQYSLGKISSIRNFFREIAWPTRVLSLGFIITGVLSLAVATLSFMTIGMGTVALFGAWVAVSAGIVAWGLYNYFKMKFVITIDGPDSSGKQEIAQVLSRYYGYTLVDAGLYYRAYANVIQQAVEKGSLEASVFENLAKIDAEIDKVRKEIRQQESFQQEKEDRADYLIKMFDYLDSLKAKKAQLVNYVENQVVNSLENAQVSMQFDRAAAQRRMRVFLNPEDAARREITDEVIPRLDAQGQVKDVADGLAIKTIVAALGKVPAVQDMMESQLRKLAREQNIIAVGQTMGSKVFDRQAQAKFYVVNNDIRNRIERKVKRRVSDAELKTEMQRLTQSDTQARTRSRDPLQAVADAVILNTTNFSLAEVVSLAHEEVVKKSSFFGRAISWYQNTFVASNKMLTRAQGENLRKRILERGGDFWEAFSDIDGLSSYNLIYGKALTNCVLDDVLAVVTETAQAPEVKRYLQKGRLETLRRMRRALFQVRLGEFVRLIPKLAVGRIYTIRHGGDEGIYVLPENLSPADTEAVLEVFRKSIQSRMHQQLMAFELRNFNESQFEVLQEIAKDINKEYEKLGARDVVRVVRDEIMGVRMMLKVGFNELSSAKKKRVIAQLQKALKGYLDQEQMDAFLKGEPQEKAGGRLLQGLVQKRMEEKGINTQMKGMVMAELVSDQLRAAAKALGVDYLEKGAVLTTTTSTGATKPSRVPGEMVAKQRNGTLTRTDINQWDDQVYELAGDFLHAGKRGEKLAVYGESRGVDVDQGMKKNQVVVDPMDKPIESKAQEEGATLLGETHTEQMKLQKLLFEDNLLLKTEYRKDGNGHKQKYETLYPRHFSIEGLRETVSQRLAFLKGKKDFKPEVYIGRAPPSTGPDKIQIVVLTPKETHLIELEGQYYGKFIEDARLEYAEDYAKSAAENMKAAGDDRAIEEIVASIKADTAAFEASVDEAMRNNFVSMFVDESGKLVSAKEAALMSLQERGRLTPKYYKFKFLNDFISYSAGDQMIALPHLAIDTIGTYALRTGKPIEQTLPAFVKAIEDEMNNPGYGNNAQVSLTAVYASMPTSEVAKTGSLGRMFQDLQVASMAKQGKITPYSRKLLAPARQSMRDLAVEKANSFYKELSAQVRMVQETAGQVIGPRRDGEAGFFRTGAVISLLGLGLMSFGIYMVIVTSVFSVPAISMIASGFLIAAGALISVKILQNRMLQVRAAVPARERMRELARRAVDFIRGNPMIILMIAAGIYSFFNQEQGGGMLAMAIVGSLGEDNGFPGKIHLRIVQFKTPEGDTLAFKIPLDRSFKNDEKITVIKNGDEANPLQISCREIYAEYIWSILVGVFSQIPRPDKNQIQIFRNGPINGVKRYLNMVVGQTFDNQESMRGELQDIISDAWDETFGDSFGLRRYIGKKTVERQLLIDGKSVRVIFTDIQRGEQLRITKILEEKGILDASLEEVYGVGLPDKFSSEDHLAVSYIDKGAEKSAYLLNLKAGKGFRSLVLKTTNLPGDKRVIDRAVEAYTQLIERNKYKTLAVGAFGKDWIVEEYFPGERITAWESEFENPSDEFLEHFESAVITVVGEYMKLAKAGGTIFDPTFKNILVRRVREQGEIRWVAAIVDMTTLEFPEDFPEERHLYRLHENFKKGWSDRREWVTYEQIYKGVMFEYGPVKGRAYLQKAMDNMVEITKERELYNREQLEYDTLADFLSHLDDATVSGTLRGAQGELLLGRLIKSAAESLYHITVEPAKALTTISAFSKDRIEEIVHALFSAQGLMAVTLSSYRGRAAPIRNALSAYLESAVSAAQDNVEAEKIKKISAQRIPIHIARRVERKNIESDQDLYETGAFHLNGRVYLTRDAFRQFADNPSDNRVVAAIVLHETLEIAGFSHERADAIVAQTTGYSTPALVARVEGGGVVSGILTSDESKPGRLQDVDDYTFGTLLPALGIDLTQNNPVTGQAPVVIDVGPGRGADTTLETAARIHAVNPEVNVIGIENSVENYRQIAPLAKGNVSFELGGFAIQQQNVDVIRCTNVLRWYRSDSEKQAAVQTMGKALREGGILIEGRISTDGKDSSILVHVKRNGQLVPYQLMMQFTNKEHEFPDSLADNALRGQIRQHLGQARSEGLKSLREDFHMLSDQILNLLPRRIISAMRDSFGYGQDPKNSDRLLVNFDEQGNPRLRSLGRQWLSLRNTLVAAMLWTGILLPVLGMGPALAIGLAYPSAKLVQATQLLVAKHGWLGALRHWGEPVGAYDPETQQMVDPVTGQAVAEAPWIVVAHETYSHYAADRILRRIGLNLSRQEAGSWQYRLIDGLSEFMAHTLDFFTAPIAIARSERSGIRTGALFLSGVFTLSGMMLLAGLAVTVPALAVSAAIAAFALSGLGIIWIQNRVVVRVAENPAELINRAHTALKAGELLKAQDFAARAGNLLAQRTDERLYGMLKAVLTDLEKQSTRSLSPKLKIWLSGLQANKTPEVIQAELGLVDEVLDMHYMDVRDDAKMGPEGFDKYAKQLWLPKVEATMASARKPELINNRYRIQSPIKRGGSGQVYRALDTKTNREVAVKVYSRAENNLQSLKDYLMMREVLPETAGVLQAHEMGYWIDAASGQESLYMVMDLVEGNDLEDILKKQPMTRENLLDFMEGLLGVFARMHQQKALYLDFKRANILFERNADGSYDFKKPILFDFGLSAMVSPNRQYSRFWDMNGLGSMVLKLISENNLEGIYPEVETFARNLQIQRGRVESAYPNARQAAEALAEIRGRTPALPFGQVADNGTIESVIEQIQRVRQIGAAAPQADIKPQAQWLRNIREGRLGQWFNSLRGVPAGLRLLMLLNNPGLHGFAKALSVGALISAWAGLGVALVGTFSVEVAFAATMLGVATFAPAQYYHYRLRTAMANDMGQQIIQSGWMRNLIQNLEVEWSDAKVLMLVQGVFSVLEQVQEIPEARQAVLDILAQLPGMAKETVIIQTKNGSIRQAVPRIILDKPYLTRKLLNVFPEILWNGEPLQRQKPIYRRGLGSAA